MDNEMMMYYFLATIGSIGIIATISHIITTLIKLA